MGRQVLFWTNFQPSILPVIAAPEQGKNSGHANGASKGQYSTTAKSAVGNSNGGMVA